MISISHPPMYSRYIYRLRSIYNNCFNTKTIVLDNFKERLKNILYLNNLLFFYHEEDSN